MEELKMKKTYINPQMVIVKIETYKMIAASQIGFGSGTKDGSNAASRSIDFDFDEEDEW